MNITSNDSKTISPAKAQRRKAKQARSEQHSIPLRSSFAPLRLCANFLLPLARIGCCVLLLTLLPLPLFPSSPPANDLDSLIARIEARYGNMRGLAADFEQRYSGSGVRERRERGRLFLQRPRRMRWEYEPKPGKLFIVNDREVWFYSPADREATRADAAKISDARFPFLFLLGQKNLRREFREIAFAAQDAGAQSGSRTLRLVPKRKDTGIREIYLEVTADGQISKVKQIDEADAVSEFSLMNVHENYLAPPEAFEFKPPPGVNVRKQK
jgi:outer membrane lipoprotein carrier protein